MKSYIGFTLAILGLVVFWFARTTLLLVFTGTLAALVVSGLVAAIRRRISLPRTVCVWIVVLATFLVTATAATFAGNAISAQLTEMQGMLRASLAAGARDLRMIPALSSLANAIDPSTLLAYLPSLLTRMGGFVGGAFGIVLAVFVVLFVAIAASLEPRLYRNGLLSLIPRGQRHAAESLMDEIVAVLQTWLLARAISMLITGALVWIGLTLLHVPLAPILGALAAALAFVPNVGAFIAGAPAILIALSISPRLALAVLVMYWLVHVVDDFAAAPFIERRIVRLPPILTLVAQLMLGFAAGTLGIMLAAPVVAVAIVVTRRLWVAPLEGGASG